MSRLWFVIFCVFLTACGNKFTSYCTVERFAVPITIQADEALSPSGLTTQVSISGMHVSYATETGWVDPQTDLRRGLFLSLSIENPDRSTFRFYEHLAFQDESQLDFVISQNGWEGSIEVELLDQVAIFASSNQEPASVLSSQLGENASAMVVRLDLSSPNRGEVIQKEIEFGIEEIRRCTDESAVAASGSL